MIRVFPRRTNWTPSDNMAFVGEPTLFRPPDQPVMISVTFTWDILESELLYRSWSRFYSDVQLGGPAFDDPGGEFIPGCFVKHGVTITSRGCGGSCDFCLVPKREGSIRELPIRDGWDVADNNLLACSQNHVENVSEMLRKQPEPIKFSGGLDAKLFQSWHVELLKTIRLKFAWFACDNPGSFQYLERVADLMSDFSIEKKRCYVLIGYNGESVTYAEQRLKSVYQLGFLPFAMLWRPADNKKKWTQEWRRLARRWSRPAAYRRALEPSA